MLKRTKLCTSLMIAFGSGIAVSAMAQQTMERVEITGSSIRRVDAETALPVTVIKVDDLTKQGVTNAEQAMQRIAANQSNFGVSQSIGATTGAKAEADLRGLGGPTGANGNKTLVLLNGRRIVNHSFDAAAVDLNAIPLNAIDRIEVLRDGASAIYGTDAIGGVINFILKRDYQGFEMSAQTQLPQHAGGGQTSRVNATAGWGSLATNGFNIMGSFDYRNQHVLEAAQRDFAKTGVIRGAVVSGTSGTSFPGDLNGFEPIAADLQPAGVDPQSGRHLLPLRLLARRRHHSAEPAGHHPGQGQLRDHAGSHRLDRVPVREEPRDLARGSGADQRPDAGDQPVLPRRRDADDRRHSRSEQPGRPERPGRRRELASGAGRQADQRRQHYDRPAARRARRLLRRRLGLQDRPGHQQQQQHRLGQQGLRQRRPDPDGHFQRAHQSVRCADRRRPGGDRRRPGQRADADRQGPGRLHRLQGHQGADADGRRGDGLRVRRRGAQREVQLRGDRHHRRRWAASASIRTATPRAAARSMRPSSS